jgi:hypothetical protein
MNVALKTVCDVVTDQGPAGTDIMMAVFDCDTVAEELGELDTMVVVAKMVSDAVLDEIDMVVVVCNFEDNTTANIGLSEVSMNKDIVVGTAGKGS